MSDSTKQTDAIIVAAGQGERSGLDVPKQFAEIDGRPMVRHSVEVFLRNTDINRLWIVIGKGQQDMLAEALEGLSGYEVLTGGATRQQSVCNGLSAIDSAGGTENILIHDAARPHITDDMIGLLISKLENTPAAVPILPTTDTVAKLDSDDLGPTVDRATLWRVQTPQAFDFRKLLNAHQSWEGGDNISDDAQIFRSAGHTVGTIPGDERLKKYTNSRDFQQCTETNMANIHTGTGYDVHKLASGEDLWLGGVKIDHDHGLVGHSDADVLLHALTDALLGAAGEGDIGDHFPPSDPKWKGAASQKFVEHAHSLIKQKGGKVHNVDMTLICEAPKIKPHRDAIRQNIAKMLDLSVDQVSVKATTTEGLGFTGRKEGIAAQAVATISMEAL